MPDRALRILHLMLASEPGGLTRYVIDLGTAMRDLGHDITVAGDRGEAHGAFEQSGLDYVEIPLKRGLVGFLKSALQLRRWLRDHPIDVLHAHYRRAALLGRRIQRNGFGGRIPLLYTLHLSHMSLRGARRWLSDFGDHTHAASEEARRWLIHDARVSDHNITVIPHGIDFERFPVADAAAKHAAKLALGLAPDALVASYVGRFDYPKNEEWMLDLACATRGQSPNLHILLVGGGPHEPALRDRIDSQNLHERVHLYGHRDPLPIYQATDLLILPSTREGFALVCAEAMSVGVPVLRTRTSGTGELIIENVTGRSVPINHDALIDAAIVMLQDRAALVRMGQAAARHIRDNFSFQRQLDQTIALYQKLTNPQTADRR